MWAIKYVLSDMPEDGGDVTFSPDLWLVEIGHMVQVARSTCGAG